MKPATNLQSPTTTESANTSCTVKKIEGITIGNKATIMYALDFSSSANDES